MKTRFPLLAMVIFVGLTGVNWSPEEAGIRLADPAAVGNHGTTLIPAPDGVIPQGRNGLWCATFQMAWDDAAKRFGRPLRLQPGCQLADSLNRTPFDRRWVDEGAVVTRGGSVTEGVLDDIDAGVRAKAGRASKLIDGLKRGAVPGDLVFFAMLHKELRFEQPFGKLGAWALGGKKVPWFGFTPDQQDTGPLLRQVRVHHYAARNDFVIELLVKDSGDQLLLAKLPTPPETPGEVGRNILKRLQADAPQAGPHDLVAVPTVAANETAEFSELHDRKVTGTTWVLRKALQSIDFRMDENGVKLHSEAAVSFSCAAHPRVNPRLMILDPPFALILKRKSAPQPYFVGWFANADLLGGK